jgi:hypothetical protein
MNDINKGAIKPTCCTIFMASPRRKYRKLQIKPDAYRVSETTTPERAAKLGGVVERPLAYANTGRIVHRRQEVRIECTLDAYKFRHMITDEQHQAACMFRWCYLTAARTIKVSDPDYSRIDGGTAITGEDKPTPARRRLREANAALSAEQCAVVENVAGRDDTAGNSRKLTHLRQGLDELFRLWF